jgi:small subunit ribosomal protein S1
LEGLLLEVDGKQGRFLLSPRALGVERARSALARGRKIEADVLGANKGGLLLDVFGLMGFVPRSELSNDDAPRHEDLVGTRWSGYLVEVFSHRVTASAWPAWRRARREKRRERFVAGLKPGEVHRGVVTHVIPFAAFVRIDRGGTFGMVGRKELTWRRINLAHEVVSPGDSVKVKVLDVRPAKRGAGHHADIDLSLRATQRNPFEAFQPGMRLTGMVTEIVPSGAFVGPEGHPGIEGLAPGDDLKTGAKVEVEVDRVDLERGRLYFRR